MSQVKIDRKLNLVVPVTNDNGDTFYVHSSPISRETFERYFDVIARTFTEIYSGGYGVFSAPRIAGMLLKKVAEGLGVWEGSSGVQRGLVEEIRRLSNVIVPGERGGWDTVPLYDAIKLGQINDDDASEVENVLAFFTVASVMHKKIDLPEIMRGASRLWGGQTTFLNCTEYAHSLPILTKEGNTGATETASSIPC